MRDDVNEPLMLGPAVSGQVAEALLPRLRCLAPWQADMLRITTAAFVRCAIPLRDVDHHQRRALAVAHMVASAVGIGPSMQPALSIVLHRYVKARHSRRRDEANHFPEKFRWNIRIVDELHAPIISNRISRVG